MSHINSTRRTIERLAWFFIVLMVNQIVFPAAALALTSGPSQPEYKTFAPAGSTEMVNLFSGDFNYNIPLLEVPGPNGGYPINLFYNSVTSPDTEASWTGLGWNINIGSMGRSMRGVPDDFDGELIGRKLDARRNETVRVGMEGGAEVAGVNLGKSIALSLGVSLGISYVYNSYTGPGLSIDPMINLGIGPSSRGSFGYQANLSLGMSVSTIDNASTNIGFSLGTSQNNIVNGQLNFNAVDGFSSMSLSSGYVNGLLSKLTKGLLRGGRGTISFAKRAYTPPVQRPWTGRNFLWDLSFMGGGTVVYGKWGLSGSYGEEYFKNAGEWEEEPAYGYNNLQNATVENLLDFNREKDGPVHNYQRYLANPVMTYDVYNIAGQGISGAFRSHRSDYGFLNDPAIHAHIPGGSFGGEGGVFWEFGFNGAYNWKDTHLSNWPYISWVSFKGKEANSDFEPFYYKMAGDISAEPSTTYDYLGNGSARDLPLRLKLEGFDYNKWEGGELLAEKNDGSGNPWYNNGGYETKVQWNRDKNHRTERKPRNVLIQPVTNTELWTSNGKEILPEYDIKYYDQSHSTGKKDINTYANSPSTDLTRPDNNQNGGFSVLGQDGVRWTYGLPVMNLEQKDAKFSYAPQSACTKRVDVNMEGGSRNAIHYKPSNSNLRSNDYIDEQKIPSYVHTYLLTSVLGNDYADIDGLPGPTDGDEGYWMKTNYVKLSNNYQWRAPFLGANYMEGYKNDVADDLAAFMWGEREVYLPASIETKTHIAYFEVSRRYDGRGAKHYIQNSTDNINDKVGAYSYKLDKIKLYSKKEIAVKGGVTNAQPLKIVHLNYDYSLCKGIPNNDPNASITLLENSNILDIGTVGTSGKLTLKEVYFTYEGNKRGRLSPYKFDYSNLNPNYTDEQIDRWGIYRSNYLQDNYNTCDNTQLPYTRQNPGDKGQLDLDVAAWHLEKVTLPSGAQLKINVERDDYGYVQDAVATRMFKITSTAKNGQNDLLVSHNPSDDDRYLQFELEQPIATSLSNKQELLQQYIDNLPVASRQGVDYKQLYYKVFINLRNSSNETFEYVPGYAEIDKNTDGTDAIEFVPSNTGQHTHARLRLKRSRIHSKGQQHHPISMRALKFLKDKLPKQMLSVDLGGPPNAMTSLDQMGENIKSLFSGYYDYGLVSEGFAKHIDLDRSYIKLNNPDKIQYGEGLRVKSIVLEDGWDTNETSTLGTVYDYTTVDEEGNIISSGVLENETQLGYDECALRWAVVQEERRNGEVKDVHDYEYPMNEGYYPGASVGYSKVTVRSLASDYALKASQAVDPTAYLNSLNLPQGFGTTGESVYEYYTAKDFPIVTSRTSLDANETNPWVSMLVEALTMVRYDHYTGTQGYSIELNDMHGKTKKITTYGQKPNGERKNSPLTMVEYNYKSKEKVDFKRGRTNQTIQVLDNEAQVLLADNPEGNALTDNQLVGVDYDFFIDGREMLQTSGMAGLAFNVDGILWVTLPFPLPQYSYNENRARTSVANKIIQRSGILEKVIAFDGQATLKTENKVFDKQTGAPLLATVENQLGGEIYNYSVPAYMAHERMGAAAKNWGILYVEVPFEPVAINATKYYEVQATHNHPNSDLWYEGDEFIAIDAAGNRTKAVYMGKLYNDNSTPTKTHQFDLIDNSFMTGNAPILLSLKNVRSGNRNLVGASIAQYSTLDINGNNANPLLNRTISSYTSPNLVAISINNGHAALTAGTTATISKSSINHVLSASGADFSDDWSLENYNYCNDIREVNPYIKGTKGIWRARSSYSYIDERKQEMRAGLPHNNEVDIRTSGTIDNVALYNWKNPFVEYSADNKWIRTQDVTKYQVGGAAVESRDVIGTYQASIYGYDNNLVIAQGVNTQYHEMAYEGFEEPNTTGTLSDVATHTNAINSGHFDILPPSATCNTVGAEQHENYRLTYPMAKPVNNKAYILVRKAYGRNNPIGMAVRLHLRSATDNIAVDGKVSAQYPLSMGSNQRFKAPGLTHLINSTTQQEFTVYEIDFSTTKHDLLTSDWWAGEVILKHPLNIKSSPNAIVLTDAYAHTGKYSMKLNQSTGNDKHKFDFNLLRLQEGKDYIFSAWIRVENGDGTPQATYQIGTNRGVQIGNQFLKPTGPIIEGWQRIEGKFTASNNQNLTIKTGIPASYDLNGLGMYIDDMRIFPADGNMVSYVYDPVDYKLQATLDDNNYATFYLYDEAGSLISSKRETERGIITIQESRSYVQPTK